LVRKSIESIDITLKALSNSQKDNLIKIRESHINKSTVRYNVQAQFDCLLYVKVEISRQVSTATGCIRLEQNVEGS
jgi:hypothetical protein